MKQDELKSGLNEPTFYKLDQLEPSLADIKQLEPTESGIKIVEPTWFSEIELKFLIF
jgi:hypothetical protein